MCELQTLLMDKKVCVGVDGCRAGWFAIALTEAGNFDTFVFSEISDLWNYFCGDHTDVHICLDIPIGLIDRSSSYKRRPCDAEARKLLAPKGIPVFLPLPVEKPYMPKAMKAPATSMKKLPAFALQNSHGE